MAAAAPTGAGIPAPEARRRSGGPCPARTTRARGTTSPSALSTMVQVPPVRDPAAPARTVARPRAARPRPGATAPPPVARLSPWRGGASKGVRGGRSPVGVAPLMRVAGRGAVVVSWSCPAPQAAPRPSPPPRVPPAPGRTAVRPVGGRPGRCPLRLWPLVAPPRCSPPARFAQLPPCGPSPGYAVCSVQEAAEPGSVPGRGAPPRVGAAQLSVAGWRRLLHCRGGAGPARRALLVASRPPGRAEQTASGFWGLRSAPGCDMLCISSIWGNPAKSVHGRAQSAARASLLPGLDSCTRLVVVYTREARLSAG